MEPTKIVCPECGQEANELFHEKEVLMCDTWVCDACHEETTEEN